jgi:Gamma-glutamyl cyclotransferase, AIG2-like
MAPGVLYRVIYGNAHPEPWQQKLTTVRPALLESHRRHRVKYMSYPAITPCTGSSVRGSVVTGLTQGDIYRLDIFEGDQYLRKKVKVKVLKNVGLEDSAQTGESEEHAPEEVEAETYIWRNDLSELEEGEWDFEEFKRERMHYWMGESSSEESNIEVDEGFADVDNAVATENGIDHTGGRGANGTISKDLESAR